MRSPSRYGIIQARTNDRKPLEPATMSCRNALFFAALMFSACPPAGASETPLQSCLDPAEFRAAGLHKLSAEELSRLETLLMCRPDIDSDEPSNAATAGSQPQQSRGSEKIVQETPAPSPQPASKPVAQTPPSEPPVRGREPRREAERQAFTARIVGDFEGWNGNTRFRLDNGQVWQQTQGREFYYSGKPEPVVEFTPGVFGSWFMNVEGYNIKARVERIR